MLFPVKGGKRLGRQKQQMSTLTAFQLTIHISPGASYIPRTEKEADSTNLTIYISSVSGWPTVCGFPFIQRLVTFTPYLQAHGICRAHLPEAWISPGWGQIGQESLLCPWQGIRTGPFTGSSCPSFLSMELCWWSQKQGLGRVLTDGHQSCKHSSSETRLHSPVLLYRMLAPGTSSGTCGSLSGHRLSQSFLL